MKFHYVVVYDPEESKWDVSDDFTLIDPEGHVWSDEQYGRGGRGFITPERGTPEYVLDECLWRTLLYIVDTFPIPQEAS